MLTYEKYPALRAIQIHVPEEPGNEASILMPQMLLVSFPGSCAHAWREPGNEANVLYLLFIVILLMS